LAFHVVNILVHGQTVEALMLYSKFAKLLFIQHWDKNGG
jgi:hypothetical protein